MSIISNMKIGTRIALGFCIVLACALIILLAGLWQMSALQANSEYLISKKVAGLTSAVAMRGSADGLALALQRWWRLPIWCRAKQKICAWRN